MNMACVVVRLSQAEKDDNLQHMGTDKIADSCE